MRDAVLQLWPEIGWIADPCLREQVTQTWIRALELSPLTADDLNQIPFTLLVPNCPTTFLEHKRCVVHIARKAAESMKEFMGRPAHRSRHRHRRRDWPCRQTGGVREGGWQARQSKRGEMLRHPLPSRWRCNVAYPIRSVTSLPPMPPKVNWSNVQPKPTSSTTPTSWRFCLSRA